MTGPELARHLHEAHGTKDDKPSPADVALHLAMHRRLTDQGHVHESVSA